MTFQNSEIYKKALQEYKDKTYAHLLNPDNVIIKWDNVFLFYKVDDKTFESYFTELLNFSKQDDYSDEQTFTKHLWYEEPRIVNYKFMWIQYKSIHLWYDWEYSILQSSRWKW